jgi:hypothetical protein
LHRQYLNNAGWIPRIYVKQLLFEKMGIKALFGGMQTQIWSGVSNPYSVVDVFHGFDRFIDAKDRVLSEAYSYLQNTFSLDRYFNLALSTDNSLPYDLLAPSGNQFNFGMPELRAYKPNIDKQNELRQQLDLHEKFVILLCTNAQVQLKDYSSLIDSIKSIDPRIALIIRPHPSYDSASSYDCHSRLVVTADQASLYDTFSLANAVITCPSSVAREARMFTDNIFVYPLENGLGKAELAQRYPWVKVVNINSKSFLARLKDTVNNKSKTNQFKEAASATESLNSLFARLDGRESHAERASDSSPAAATCER